MVNTGKDFVGFWSWAVGKGLMNSNTARALGAAVKQVMMIEDNWESKEISTTFNADEILARFKNLKAKNFKPESLLAYDRRFRQALSLFLKYQEDPANWKPEEMITKRIRSKGEVPNDFPGKPNDVVPKTPEPPPTSGVMDYPFPLRENCIARVRIPTDIKMTEVERLAAFLRALAIDFSPTST